MRLFINEGIIVLRDFVQNIFLNEQCGTKLIDFMKSIDFYESKSLLKKKKMVLKDILEVFPDEFQIKISLLDKYKGKQIIKLDISNEDRQLLIQARSKSFTNQVNYLLTKVYDGMVLLCEKLEAENKNMKPETIISVVTEKVTHFCITTKS